MYTSIVFVEYIAPAAAGNTTPPDEDGAGWSFLHTATLAVALAASLAVTGRSVQAQYADEVVVPQATAHAPDDSGVVPQFVVRPTIATTVFEWQDEIHVTVDDDASDPSLFVVARRATLAFPAAPDTSEIVAQPAATIQVDELYWQAPDAILTRPRDVIALADEVIVPQPVPLAIDEGVWSPPVVMPVVRWLHVAQSQDELVPTIRVDESAPDPWLLVPAKRIIALPSLDEDVALASLNTSSPFSGINRVRFDASATTVVFDSLVTRVVFDANGTVVVLDSLTTTLLFDSLTTTSVFDG